MSDMRFSGAAEVASLFLLQAPLRSLEATGCRTRLPAGPAATLAARVRTFFATPRSGPALLVGALPFDPHADDALFQPEQLTTPDLHGRGPLPVLAGEIVAEPPAAAYADAVAQALVRLQAAAGAPCKVVLARSLHAQAAQPVNPRALAARLGRDASVATYVAPLPVAEEREPAWLVGASPELLISRRGTAIVSHPLAGSARRSADPAEDARIAERLLASAKDLDEHRYVVDAIVEALKPLCGELDAPERPGLHATATMWHLGTRITGTLKDAAVSAAELAGLLHPTPAVCGTPREPALAAIQTLEPVARGFYAGAVGWTDAEGDGDWYVAIRCAHVQGTALRLFAGAGIVAESRPEAEVDETAGKFMAMLNALGIDDEQALSDKG
ncbi:MAG: isochorismate synthase [Candidatus Dactylopiibacterium carminicum]|uniref:isochorismate synthase n=1 Tax=Candidatus Dactylopiibacterium carminicum TaxID=857335 RepID=A0A272EXV5_9RHOO|nr:isochorismate synthase [Candidatus Dactylopiibacterium carminicum]KAF7600493.1 isochorismate synthase [Candidatus Dactylopiibacterium carminicum]PAS94939.1 MAG: isochorismate synthase [Candidatus Dactylopiibacterium carminicum]PAS98074.1 MAG: isochorismate synthase [Candidatus Dactylopiibacterium carminicum]PAT00496.1 MAG: isochorismate synthase [Candidatus Dactylopiibacterium carminicum]